MKVIKLIFGIATATMASCTAKPYSHYLVEPEIEVDEAIETQPDTPVLRNELRGQDQLITMKWNDGQTYSEVSIPISAAGRIILKNGRRTAGSDDPGPQMLLPPPVAGDTGHIRMEKSYLERGLKIDKNAPPVSLSRARTRLDAATNTQNFGEGLLIIDAVLKRYPSHPEYLKARGSLHLLLGDRQLARASYEKSLEIEDDPAVSRKLDELDRF